MRSLRRWAGFAAEPGALRLRWGHTLFRALATFAKRKPLGAIGGVVLLAMVLVALLAPLIAPFDPREVHVTHKYAGPGTTCENLCYEGTGKTLWLGADQLGRDILSRLMWGARNTLFVSLVAVGIGVTSGALIGVISAYFGGLVDLILQRFLDTLMAFPSIILAMAIVAVAGASLRNVIIALLVILIPGAARVVRSQALAVKEMDYMLAGRALGASNWRLIFRHLMPNCMAPYIVFATSMLGATIVVEAALSFLGVGTSPDDPTWGGMLSVAGKNSPQVSPWLVTFPSLAVVLAVFAFNLLGDALRDVLDPRLRGTG